MGIKRLLIAITVFGGLPALYLPAASPLNSVELDAAINLLIAGKSAPEVENRAIASLADELGPENGASILAGFKRCVVRRPDCLNAVMGSLANAVKTTQDETYLCALCDTLVCCKTIPKDVSNVVAHRFADRQDLKYAAPKLAAVLVRAGHNPADRLTWLRQRLNDADKSNVICAAEALGSIGPAASSAQASLEPLLSSTAPDVRVFAASAIWRIGDSQKPDLIERVLEQALSDKDEYVALQPWSPNSGTELSHRDVAICRLGEMKVESVQIAEQLTGMLHKLASAQPGSTTPRKLALIQTLTQLSVRSTRLLPVLKEVELNQKDPTAAHAAKLAVQNLSKNGKK